MTEGVVHLLEVIEVHVREREDRSVAEGPVNLGRHAIEEGAGVREPGQVIRERELLLRGEGLLEANGEGHHHEEGREPHSRVPRVRPDREGIGVREVVGGEPDDGRQNAGEVSGPLGPVPRGDGDREEVEGREAKIELEREVYDPQRQDHDDDDALERGGRKAGQDPVQAADEAARPRLRWCDRGELRWGGHAGDGAPGRDPVGDGVRWGLQWGFPWVPSRGA